MQVSRRIKITMSEEEASKLTCEIDSLCVKFDKEYVGGEYDELDDLKKLKLLIEGE
ncbi:MAG: hypothetical protein PHG06_00085 [Parabacteroides sp.]|nr:hypothetical protein [Parabacteroides sp.]